VPEEDAATVPLLPKAGTMDWMILEAARAAQRAESAKECAVATSAPAPVSAGDAKESEEDKEEESIRVNRMSGKLGFESPQAGERYDPVPRAPTAATAGAEPVLVAVPEGEETQDQTRGPVGTGSDPDPAQVQQGGAAEPHRRSSVD
jgi:hypothetical protein